MNLEHLYHLTVIAVPIPSTWLSALLLPTVQDPSKPYQVAGSVLTMVERLDDEYTKLLQNADSRSPVYVARLGVWGECGEVCMQSLVRTYVCTCNSVGV